MPEIPTVGPWAKQKLDCLGRYLDFYTKVLQKQRWRTIYIDAFAGAGQALIRSEPRRISAVATLFPEMDALDIEQQELIDGSPRVALELANPFSRYVFVDADAKRGQQLNALQQEYADRRVIDVLQTSASQAIERIVSENISRSTHRGVAFLDPFGANLEWSVIRKLADTELFEVVINFPLNMAIQRMLPNTAELPDTWVKTLDAYFGTHDWFDEVYQERGGVLFLPHGLEKRPDYLERLLELYRRRLKAEFGYVSTPRLIRNTRGAPLYYLLWAGPHSMGLKGANYILKMGERMGGRRTSS